MGAYAWSGTSGSRGCTTSVTWADIGPSTGGPLRGGRCTGPIRSGSCAEPTGSASSGWASAPSSTCATRGRSRRRAGCPRRNGSVRELQHRAPAVRPGRDRPRPRPVAVLRGPVRRGDRGRALGDPGGHRDHRRGRGPRGVPLHVRKGPHRSHRLVRADPARRVRGAGGEDFALTELATERLTADWRAAHPGRELKWPGYGRAPAAVMELVFADLTARYGSVRGYLGQRVGITDAVTARLRDRLLAA